MIDQHLSALILKQRGNNRKLAEEIIKLSTESKDKLFYILRDLETENNRLKNDVRKLKVFPFRWNLNNLFDNHKKTDTISHGGNYGK